MILTPDIVEFKTQAIKGEMRLPALSVVELKSVQSMEVAKSKPDIGLVIQKPELAKVKELPIETPKKKMKM